MIIGFRQRSQTIVESDVVLSLDVRSSILSELDYEVQFQLRKRIGRSSLQNQLDVHFVNADDPSNPLKFSSKLPNNSLDLAVLPQIHVLNDSFIESEECYTVTISSQDNVESFTCNVDTDNPTDFFCLHTVCIEDDDGQFALR